MYSRYFIILSSPITHIDKKVIYSPFSLFSQELGQYIKAVPAAFFLSNNFRHDTMLYFLTTYKEEQISIVFEGQRLKFLGPSFFSSANLILRAITSLNHPKSKKGKLTPGLYVKKQDLSELKEQYKDKVWYKIIQKRSNGSITKTDLPTDAIYCFGDTNNKWLKNVPSIDLPLLDIDEQVTIVNYFIDRQEESDKEES